jgi:hypothetical protein
MSAHLLGEGAIPAATGARPAPLASARPPPEAKDVVGSPFATVLRALGHESDRGEALVQQALRAGRAGSDPSPAELLALQAGIYRYGEVVDIATKLVDRASTDVKTVLQGQQ